MRKIRVLLVWQYSRKDWVELFKKLSNDFEFIFIGEVFKTLSTEYVDEFAEVTYWSKYSNAFELLNDIKPNKIVFMGTESLHTIALNYAAREKKISTYYLQHGIFAPLSFYINAHKKANDINGIKSSSDRSLVIFMTKFYLLTFGIHLRALGYLVNYIIYKGKMSQVEFLIKNRFQYRILDRYIVYTISNALFLSHRDQFPVDKYQEIGDPNFDKYYRKGEHESSYLLLIDIPLVEIRAEGRVVKRSYTADKANEFYSMVNEYCMDKGVRLKIKIHPYNFESTFYLEHSNIDYIRECSIPDLIDGANMIVSFFSTLTLPCILKKPFLLIRTNDEEALLNDLEKWGLPACPNFENFLYSDIQFIKMKDYSRVLTALQSEYIYKFDGCATMRFKTILLTDL
jgi:hypothetical protein